MSAIGPGDWVEAIGPKGVESPRAPGVFGGGVYCVEALVWTNPHCGGCGGEHAGIHLVGKARARNGWRGCEFRPVYRPKADLIESLKAPPVRVGEFA